MRNYHLSTPPQTLRRASVHLDNVALVPASMLPLNAAWQAIANGLPEGEMLIVLPYQAKQQRVVCAVASYLRMKGKQVRLVGQVAGKSRLALNDLPQS